MPRGRALGLATALLLALGAPAARGADERWAPAPPALRAALERATTRLGRLAPESAGPGTSLRRLSLDGPRDTLVAVSQASHPAPLALRWTREIVTPGGCPGGQPRVRLWTFVARPAWQWGAARLEACAGPAPAAALTAEVVAPDATVSRLAADVLSRLAEARR